MQAKAYLKRIKKLTKDIEGIEEELANIRLQVSGLRGQSFDSVRVISSTHGDHMANAVIRMMEVEERLTDRQAELTEEREKIIKEVQALPDPRHSEILRLRYVAGLSFEEIAERMHYTERWTYQIHGEALQAFELLHVSSG